MPLLRPHLHRALGSTGTGLVIPSGQVQVDLDLFPDISAYYLTALGKQNLVGSKIGGLTANASAALAPSPIGPTTKLNGSTQTLSCSDTGFPTGDLTVACLFQWKGAALISTTGNAYMVNWGVNTATGDLVGLYIGSTSGTTFIGRLAATQWGASANNASAPRVDDGKVHAAVMTRKSGSWTIYCDGAIHVGPTSLASNTVLGGTFTVGHFASDGIFFNGWIDNVVIWPRALGNADALLLTREPFALLRPAFTPLRIVQSGTTFTATLSANNAALAAGSPLAITILRSGSAAPISSRVLGPGLTRGSSTTPTKTATRQIGLSPDGVIAPLASRFNQALLSPDGVTAPISSRTLAVGAKRAANDAATGSVARGVALSRSGSSVPTATGLRGTSQARSASSAVTASGTRVTVAAKSAQTVAVASSTLIRAFRVAAAGIAATSSSLTRRVGITRSATAATATSLGRSVSHATNATATAIATAIHSLPRSYLATTSALSALSRSTALHQAGLVAATATLSRAGTLARAALTSATGTLARSVAIKRAASAAATANATAIQVRILVLAALATVAGSLTRRASLVRLGIATTATSASHAMAVSRVVAVSAVASAVRRVAQARSVAAVAIGSLSVAQNAIQVTLAAAASVLSSMGRVPALLRRSITAPATSAQRASSRGLVGSASGSASLSQGPRPLVALATTAGTALLSRAASALRLGSASASAALARSSTIPRAGLVVATGRLGLAAGLRRLSVSSPIALFARSFGLTLSGLASVVAFVRTAIPAAVGQGRRIIAAELLRLIPSRAVARSMIAPFSVRSIVAAILQRASTARTLQRIIGGTGSMLDPIHVNDTDAFIFDFSAWFPSAIDAGLVTFASLPAGWTFSGPSVSASRVTVYATAPGSPGSYVLECGATDDTPRHLTLTQSIQVVR